MVKLHIQSRRWTLVFAVFSVVFSSVIMLINYAIDPVWATGGNKVGEVNFAFNERRSKFFLFESTWISQQREPKVLILGSSKSIPLNHELIAEGNCFNFAFGAGIIEEYLELGRYLQKREITPQVFIVELSRFNFEPQPLARSKFPDFVAAGEPPSGLFWEYLNWDNLGYSIRTLTRRGYLPRPYNERFVVQPYPSTPPYKPSKYRLRGPRIELKRILLFKELKSIFPDSRFIGYVPPLSSWRVVRAYRSQKEMYFKPLIELEHDFGPIIDYSIPSELTSQLANTHDGIHYQIQLMDIVAQELSRLTESETSRPDTKRLFGVVVDSGGDNYQKIFKESVDRFQDSTRYGLEKFED